MTTYAYINTERNVKGFSAIYFTTNTHEGQTIDVKIFDTNWEAHQWLCQKVPGCVLVSKKQFDTIIDESSIQQHGYIRRLNEQWW